MTDTFNLITPPHQFRRHPGGGPKRLGRSPDAQNFSGRIIGMTKNSIRIALALALASLAPAAIATERFSCFASTTCTLEGGCKAGDSSWVTNIWKQGDVWLVTEEPGDGVPEIYTEVSWPSQKDGTLFLEKIWHDREEKAVQMLTILADGRMIDTWHFDEPWYGFNEHTALGVCTEEE